MWLRANDYRAVFTDNKGNYALVWEEGYTNTETYDDDEETRENLRREAVAKLGSNATGFRNQSENQGLISAFQPRGSAQL
jgi:hypothetical protein